MTSNNSFARRMVVALGGTLVAACAGATLASSGYATDSGNNVITSDFGECVKTGEWTPGLNTPACDPALAARLEAERLAAEQARHATELAAMESSAPNLTLMRISDKRNVMFEFNSAALTPAAMQEMDHVLGKLHELNDVTAINIVGHTDSTGPESYNQGLSERRALSVRQFLESRGISPGVLSAQGEGEVNPVADNATRDGRARNRRVDILISGDVAK